MASTDRPLAWLRRLALACAVMALAVTGLSASLRLAKAGPGCGGAVACGQAETAVAAAAEPPTLRAARTAHRIVASAVLLTLLAMLVLCRRARLRREARAVLVLLGVTLFLAVLGRWAGGSGAAPVVVAHVLGGFLLFALSLRLALAPRLAPMAPRWRRWSAAATAVLLAQLALGALTSASGAGLACGDSAVCGLHRYASLLVLPAVLPLAWAALRGGRARTGAALLLLLAAQLAAGLAAAALALPFMLVLLHNGLGAGLLAVLLLAPGGPGTRENTRPAA